MSGQVLTGQHSGTQATVRRCPLWANWPVQTLQRALVAQLGPIVVVVGIVLFARIAAALADQSIRAEHLNQVDTFECTTCQD